MSADPLATLICVVDTDSSNIYESCMTQRITMSLLKFGFTLGKNPKHVRSDTDAGFTDDEEHHVSKSAKIKSNDSDASPRRVRVRLTFISFFSGNLFFLWATYFQLLVALGAHSKFS